MCVTSPVVSSGSFMQLYKLPAVHLVFLSSMGHKLVNAPVCWFTDHAVAVRVFNIASIIKYT